MNAGSCQPPEAPSAPLRVLVVGRGEPEQGGIPTFLRHVVRGLGCSEGVEAEFLNLGTTGPRGGGGELRWSNIERTLRDVAAVWKAARRVDVVYLHQSTDPAVTVVRGGLLAAAGRAGRASVVLHAHSGSVVEWARHRRNRWLQRTAYAGVQAYVAVSRPIAATLRGVHRRRPVRYVPNAVPVSDYAPGAGRGRGDVRVAYVGQVSRAKGLLVLLDAVKPLEGIELYLTDVVPTAGAAEHRVVRSAYEDAGLAFVRWVPGMAPAEIPAFLADVDVLVLPSLSEGLPMVVLEAMAAGLPVVATDVGQVGSVVEDGDTGLLVPPGSVTELQEALRRLAAEPALRQGMGLAARRKAEADHDLELMCERLLGVLREVGAGA